MLSLRPRYLRRYRRIADVLVRHGFGAIVAQLGLDQALDLRQRLAPDPEQPITRKTAAIHLREAIEELGPTFIKFGQIASTRPDVFPPEFIDELAGLQDKIPPAPWNEIQAAIEAELGRPLNQLFLVIDPTPIASASLGQVYAAMLPDQTAVIVKVQRPNIEQTIETDLGILADLARLAQERLPSAAAVDLVGIVDEFAESLRGELDYRVEARNADRFRANFAREEYVYAPKVYWDYTTRHVMVQERIRGIKINDYPALVAAGYDRDRIATNAAKAIIKEVLVDGYFHADPHPGNLLILSGEVIGLIDFGVVGTLDRTDRAQLVRLWSSIINLDAEGTADQLLRMGIAGPQTDQVGLTRALRKMLRKYSGLPLKEIVASEVLNDVQPIIYEYKLQVPTDYWLLIKTLVTMEGVGKALAPNFDVFAASAPYVQRFLFQMALPQSWAPGIIRQVTGWVTLVSLFPRQATRVMGRLESSDLELRVHVPEIRQATRESNSSTNRTVMAILVGAMVIALALLLPALRLESWPWDVVTWLIVFGFIFLSVVAFWLIVSILRSLFRR
ncbi:MAG: AarF/ABC1/UbiB kinase family protein [Anaerolineae bacterium]|nr:AarF/ABC1/UbiB kinase family protein [Anaerolineae bacterium]